MRYFDTASDDFGIDPSAQGNSTISYVNEAGVPEEVARQAYRNADISSVIDRWMRGINGEANGDASRNTGDGSMFFRSRFSLTTSVYDQMLQCTDAVEYDEILSTIADVSEALAFNRMSFECIDQDQEDIWNQVAADLDLDSRLREMWRELYKVSQVYVAIEWGQKVYTVRTPVTDLIGPPKNSLPPELVNQQNKIKAAHGQTPETFNQVEGDQEDPQEDPQAEQDPNKPTRKRRRRKQFALYVPTALSVLDPTKVVPVGQMLFQRERFAYLASGEEHRAFLDVFDGKLNDPTVMNLLEGPYTPTDAELHAVGMKGGAKDQSGHWWLFRRGSVFRHTLTRASYERFASVRLKSVLPLLDMKTHLRASDRATLIGSTNFIVVLKRGSERWPARQGEIEQLREQARVVARMPILVGDHRLSVEIVTPNQDHTLDRDRYDALDERIVMRAMGTFRPGGKEAGGSSDAEMDMKVVARGIESRRHELGRTLEQHLLKITVEKNATALTETPSMVFHPRRVAVGMSDTVLNAILKLRDRGDISRETELEELDYDQDTEFIRRRRERERYDSAFKSSVPHASPLMNPFGAPGGMPGAPGAAPGGPAGPDGQGSTENGRPPGAKTGQDNVPK